MTGQPPVTNVNTPTPDVPSVKKNMALAALALTIVASLLIILGFFLAGKAGAAALSNFDEAAASCSLPRS
uniref:hypothetical protein n=1 Tax=uncultured Mobiluncus sp. TaxID=293425 RepID=UPI0026193D85